MQRLKPVTQQDLPGLEPLPLASLVPQSCRAKGLFRPGTRKSLSLALSQLQKSPSTCDPIPCSQCQGPRPRVGVPTYAMYSQDDLWQAMFPLSSNVSPLRHPGPVCPAQWLPLHAQLGTDHREALAPSSYPVTNVQD